MSIQKKSLISTLKTTKKANVMKEDFTVSPATASPVVKAATSRQAVQKAATSRQAIVKSATTRSATVRSAARR